MKIKVINTCPCGKKCRPYVLGKKANIQCPKCQAKDNARTKQAETEYTINTPEYKAAREEYVLRRARGEDVGNFKFP